MWLYTRYIYNRHVVIVSASLSPRSFADIFLTLIFNTRELFKVDYSIEFVNARCY